MDTIQLLFKLIRAEICGEELSNINIDYTTLTQLWALSKSHDMAHIVSSALFRYGLIDTNTELAGKFKQQQMLALSRCSMQQHELSRIINALESAEIPFIILKGSVIRDYYPQPWMRTSCDIDILVKERDAEGAVKALVENEGYELKARSAHDYSLFSPSDVHLELHFTLVEDDREISAAAAPLKDIWDSSVSANGSCGFLMSNEMFMFYHIVHMAKHFVLGGCGIRAFIDLWLLENKLSFDRITLSQMLKKAGLLKFYNTAVMLSEVWLSSKEYSDLTLKTEKFILRGGVYGSIKNKTAVSAGQGESKAKSILSLAFLSRKALECMYPKLASRPWLFFFYQVKRWFRIFKKDKRNKITNITKSISLVSQQNIDFASNLISDLELTDI